MAKPKKPNPESDAIPKGDAVLPKETGPDRDAPVDNQSEVQSPPELPEQPKATADQDHSKKDEEPPVASPVAGDEPARRGVFLPAVIGGLIAASLGFVAARTEVFDPVLPKFLQSNDQADAVLALQMADIERTKVLVAFKADLAALKPPDMAPIEAQLATLQAGIDPLRSDSETLRGQMKDIESRLESFDVRLAALEKRPMTEGASQEAIAAYDRELAALRDAVAGQRAMVETMVQEARTTKAAAQALEQQAASAARLAQTQATVGRLIVALDRGAGYAPILAELATGGIAVPDVLGAMADDGVASLAALRDAFPVAARAALSAARADASDGGGLTGFVQRQLGARSVQPRQGDDPDAILSRAEAALTAGNLAQALQEIATLPDPARAQMQGWVDTADKRISALNAANELAQSLNTN